MEPIVDHIQITVRDMQVAVPFYDRLMPLLGFDKQTRRVHTTIASHELEVCDYTHPKLGFCISSPREPFKDDAVHRRRPGSLHHLAFRASSRAEVDTIHGALTDLGATIVSAPRVYPEYSPHYYAVFFKDPEGIKYEVVFDAPESP
ncbi:MAG: VOC family protein [Planctomycetes bacterium]|nr:VOC family protein [Planctomycetota bacterium]